MAPLSEWLDIMLGEVARKQDEAALAAAEQARREGAQPAPPPTERKA
jgi:hypothetical protein